MSATERRHQFENQLYELQKDINSLSSKLEFTQNIGNPKQEGEKSTQVNGSNGHMIDKRRSLESYLKQDDITSELQDVERENKTIIDKLNFELHNVTRERDESTARFEKTAIEMAQLRKANKEMLHELSNLRHIKHDHETLLVSLESSERIRKQQKDLITLLQKSHQKSESSMPSYYFPNNILLNATSSMTMPSHNSILPTDSRTKPLEAKRSSINDLIHSKPTQTSRPQSSNSSSSQVTILHPQKQKLKNRKSVRDPINKMQSELTKNKTATKQQPIYSDSTYLGYNSAIPTSDQSKNGWRVDSHGNNVSMASGLSLHSDNNLDHRQSHLYAGDLIMNITGSHSISPSQYVSTSTSEARSTTMSRGKDWRESTDRTKMTRRSRSQSADVSNRSSHSIRKIKDKQSSMGSSSISPTKTNLNRNSQSNAVRNNQKMFQKISNSIREIATTPLTSSHRKSAMQSKGEVSVAVSGKPPRPPSAPPVRSKHPHPIDNYETLSRSGYHSGDKDSVSRIAMNSTNELSNMTMMAPFQYGSLPMRSAQTHPFFSKVFEDHPTSTHQLYPTDKIGSSSISYLDTNINVLPSKTFYQSKPSPASSFSQAM